MQWWSRAVQRRFVLWQPPHCHHLRGAVLHRAGNKAAARKEGSRLSLTGTGTEKARPNCARRLSASTPTGVFVLQKKNFARATLPNGCAYARRGARSAPRCLFARCLRCRPGRSAPSLRFGPWACCCCCSALLSPFSMCAHGLAARFVAPVDQQPVASHRRDSSRSLLRLPRARRPPWARVGRARAP